MYSLNKIIGFVLSPIGITFILGGATFVCAMFNWKRIAKCIGLLATLWLWLWMTPFMTRFVGAPLEREFLVDDRVPDVTGFPTGDAIVLHGGSMGVNTNLSGYAEMCTSADRVWQAARLWKAGKAPRIIATGDGARDSTLGLLKDFGVDEKCVEFLDARNTEEEARVVGKLFNRVERVEGELGVRGQESGIRSQRDERTGKPKVLLVTSAWHMKRARLMFEKYAKGVEVVCAPADFEMSMAMGSAVRWRDLILDFNAFALNSVAFHEWVGLVGYKLIR